jgi:hypothetical protein
LFNNDRGDLGGDVDADQNLAMHPAAAHAADRRTVDPAVRLPGQPSAVGGYESSTPHR